MNDQTDTREFLHRMADETGFAPVEPGPVVRKARRRLSLTVGGTLLMVGALVAGGMVGVDRLMTDERTQTPASTGPTVVPDHAYRVGLIGLPPEGAMPSTPERGKLVLGFGLLYGQGDGGRYTGHLYADGRLIWWRLGPPENPVGREQQGHLERRLTAEGVELLRAEMVSAGLFDHDLNLVGTHSLYDGYLEVRNGDRLVRVTWGDTTWGSERDVAETMPTPEQVSALQRLRARLADPASWLPASAWENPEIRPYVASRYSVCAETQPGASFARVLDSLPRAAADLLGTWDRRHRIFGPPVPMESWCSPISTEEARGLAQILEDAGIREDHFGDEVSYEVLSRDPNGTAVSLVFYLLLPHQG